MSETGQMSKQQLIAAVAVDVFVQGQRLTLEPGQALPELSAHDTRQLLDSGAVHDEGARIAQERAQARSDQAAQTDFLEARERVRQENEARAQAQTQAQTDAKAQTLQAGEDNTPTKKPGKK